MLKTRLITAVFVAFVFVCGQLQILGLTRQTHMPAIATTLTQAALSGNPNHFGDAEYYEKVTGHDKPRTVKGSIVFDSNAKNIRFLSKDPTQLEVPYAGITNIVYERAAKPRYALGLLVAWPLLFTKSKKHYMTIQYKAPDGQGQYAVFRLDKSNFQAALATAEAQTGIKVERIGDK